MADYQVMDEQSKLHTSFVSSEALTKLGMTNEQIASLLDWIDPDDDVQSEGAEDDFYLGRNIRYSCKNAPLSTLSELKLIRGFAGADYHGEDANHNHILDPGEDANADGHLRVGWVDLLTCLGDGRLNINTAPLEILKTLPLSAGAAQQIIAYRGFDWDSGDSLEDHVFRSADDINQLQGLEPIDAYVLSLIATFRSTHYRIFAQAVHALSGLRHDVEVVVRVGAEDLEVLQWTTAK